MASLPLKMSIIKTISENSNINIQDIMKKLESEYGQEGQFTKKNLTHLIQALKAVGNIEATNRYIDDQGELCEEYTITEAGNKSLSYIPKTTGI